MKATFLTLASALALSFTIAACSSEVEPPAPTPAPSPAPTQAAPPAPPAPIVNEPVFENYLDAPQTPGTWTYRDEPGEKLALFGADQKRPVFLIRCAAGALALGRVTDEPQSAPRVMTVTTETVSRQLRVEPVPGREIILAAAIDAGDPLLDAMAITKGRFAVGVEGERTLYLPAWAEVTRVIEDCR